MNPNQTQPFNSNQLAKPHQPPNLRGALHPRSSPFSNNTQFSSISNDSANPGSIPSYNSNQLFEPHEPQNLRGVLHSHCIDLTDDPSFSFNSNDLANPGPTLHANSNHISPEFDFSFLDSDFDLAQIFSDSTNPFETQLPSEQLCCVPQAQRQFTDVQPSATNETSPPLYSLRRSPKGNYFSKHQRA